MALLDVERLRVRFGDAGDARTPFAAVDGVDLSIEAGEAVGLVGESGCGKSVTALAVMGLVEEPGHVQAERIAFDGRDLRALTGRAHRELLGRDIAMVFQDPMTSLNPCFTVAWQLVEALRLHEGGTRRALAARALELLRAVEIPDAERRLASYPHQLSGGMAQRVMIAMAIACRPRLLIADEPTTALDVTIQAQILALLHRLRRERDMALLLITHDLGVVAEVARRVLVMYAGQVVETGAVPTIFEAPRHPYTAALLAALPERNRGRRRLAALPGVVPGLAERPAGCRLAPRCPRAQPRCSAESPPLYDLGTGSARCFYPLPASGGDPAASTRLALVPVEAMGGRPA
ncbi:MAG TPA: ABC transporter ATP-binding protein [Caldimonas sp.]|nr:ABC transporter ATP-binding protein [Caldimonas sp.]